MMSTKLVSVWSKGTNLIVAFIYSQPQREVISAEELFLEAIE